MGMLPIQPGSDLLPCRERGVGWDGPWLDERICKVQVSVNYKAIVAGWWRRRPTAPGWTHAGRRRPQEEEATSLMRSWWGPSDISAKLLQHVGRFQTLPGTCCQR